MKILKFLVRCISIGAEFLLWAILTFIGLFVVAIFLLPYWPIILTMFGLLLFMLIPIFWIVLICVFIGAILLLPWGLFRLIKFLRKWSEI
jgi:hypothetical protein